MPTALGPVLLVIASSLAWAGLDSCRKALLRDVEPVPLLALLTLASVPPFAVWAAVAPGAPLAALLRPAYWLPALGTVLLNLVANFSFMQAVRLSPLSLTIPLLSLTPVCATLIAIPLLGERPGWANAVGILMVVVGAFWLSQSSGAPEQPPAPGGGSRPPAASFWRSLRHEPGVPLMALTALLWSFTLPFDKLAVRQAGATLHGLVLTAAVGLGFLLVLALRGRLATLAQMRRVPGLLALGVAVSVLALGLQLLALGGLWVAWVETLKRGVGSLAAVAMGRLAFGEAVTPGKVAAVLLMIAGVALLLLA
jgi:drug/metabolite transporter (DMT)-like permease